CVLSVCVDLSPSSQLYALSLHDALPISLGVVSALAAVDELRATGFRPRRPLAVVVFAEEEGGRFGVACLGSRLLTGAIAPERARSEEHTSELQSREKLVCRLLLEKKKDI